MYETDDLSHDIRTFRALPVSQGGAGTMVNPDHVISIKTRDHSIGFPLYILSVAQ